jgi:5'-methylthioadenosine phosphorylase
MLERVDMAQTWGARKKRPQDAPKGGGDQARAAMAKSVLGIVGGSGLYDIPILSNVRWQSVASPWGTPSDDILFAELDGLPIRFLPRHGRGHKVPPSAIDFRANIDALKRAGVTDLVSVSACGSLKEELPPGHFVLVDQFIDRTFAREKSFFGPGCVAHVSVADPVSPGLVDLVEAATTAEGIACTRGGTYLVMEGPQFSTRAESDLYRSWGCDVIGMTNMPEAKLAREAEICYATVAMVTDYDCWHDDHAHVDVAAVIKVLTANVDKAHRMIVRLARDFPRQHPPCPIGSDHALDVAIITPPEARDALLLNKLDAVAGRVLAGKV